MSFVSSQSSNQSQTGSVENNPFYPDIDIADFYAAMNIGNDVTLAQARQYLLAAIFITNDILKGWKSGYPDVAKLDDIPADIVNAQSCKVFFYTQAVYAKAKSMLVENRRDVSTTPKGHDQADALEETTADYLRQFFEATRKIMDKRRIEVELI